MKAFESMADADFVQCQNFERVEWIVEDVGEYARKNSFWVVITGVRYEEELLHLKIKLSQRNVDKMYMISALSLKPIAIWRILEYGVCTL